MATVSYTMEFQALAMIPRLIVLLCSADGLSQYNKEAMSTNVLRLFQSEESSVGQCSYYISSDVILDMAVFQWLSEHSRGLNVFEEKFMAAQNGSFLRKYWQTSFCTVLVTAENIAMESLRLLHRVVARNKVLIVLVEDHYAGDSLMEAINSKIWSFDIAIVESKTVQILCQGLGSIANIVTDHLHECSEAIPFTLSRTHIQISGGVRVPYILTSGKVVVGTDIELIKLLQRKFGFQYHLKREVNFGIDSMPNGTTFGLMDSLGKRESELGVGELLANPDRHKYVDFSTPTYYMQIVIATPKPKRVSALFAIFYPLDRITWAATAVTLALVVLILLLIDHVYYGGKHSRRAEDVFIIYSILLQSNPPNSWFSFKSYQSRTLLLLFWLLATFFISSGYKSVLLAKLTFIEHEKPIDTAQDILQSGLPVIVANLTAPQLFISSSVQPNIQKIYHDSCLGKNGLVPFNGSYPTWVNIMLDAGRAILVDDILSINQSKLHVAASVTAGAQNSHVLYPLNSKLAPLMDRVLRQAKAMGLLQKFLNDFTSSGTNAGGDASASAITIEHLFPVLLLDLIGTFMAVVVFVGFELMRKRYRRLEHGSPRPFRVKVT